MPDQESWPFNLLLTTNGVKSGEVQAGYMAHFARRDEYELSDSVVVDFYDEYGNHTSRLMSDFATVSVSKNIIVANENVTVVSDSGITLLTDELHWDNYRSVVYTDNFVTFITETDTLFGHGFESDRSLRRYKIFNPTGVAHRKVGSKK